jgi:hypothetical protein
VHDHDDVKCQNKSFVSLLAIEWIGLLRYSALQDSHFDHFGSHHMIKLDFGGNCSRTYLSLATLFIYYNDRRDLQLLDYL